MVWNLLSFFKFDIGLNLLMTINSLCLMRHYNFSLFIETLLLVYLDTFLELLEPYILRDMLGSLPPEVSFVKL